MPAILWSLTIPVYAGNNYLFPSDIIDQSEQSRHDVERQNRYAAQRKWTYPEASQSTAKKNFYPDSGDVTFDGQPVPTQNQSQKYPAQGYYSQPHYNQPAYNRETDSSWFDESEYYKYSDVKASRSQAESPYTSEQTSPLRQFARELRYPGDHSVRQSGSRYIQRKIQQDSSGQMGGIQRRQYVQPYPDLLYPSDMEVDRRSINNNLYRPNSFSSNFFSSNALPENQHYARQAEPTRQNTRIQYVPVPMYRVPGTLPGTVPGVVTPGKMMPGYSHLSPDYNYADINSALQAQRLLKSRGLNHSSISPFMGTQYNPLTGLGIFPGSSNPFDGFYKTYGNHSQGVSPFISPDTMVPGFSMPEMFAPH